MKCKVVTTYYMSTVGHVLVLESSDCSSIQLGDAIEQSHTIWEVVGIETIRSTVASTNLHIGVLVKPTTAFFVPPIAGWFKLLGKAQIK